MSVRRIAAIVPSMVERSPVEPSSDPLLVFGPRKLPELGKGLGEGLKGFKEGIKGITTSDPAPQQQQTIAKSEAPQQPPAATQAK